MDFGELLKRHLSAGGLADVMNALPKALARRGHRVMSVAPRYEPYAEGWETGSRLKVRVYGQEHEVSLCLKFSMGSFIGSSNPEELYSHIAKFLTKQRRHVSFLVQLSSSRYCCWMH